MSAARRLTLLGQLSLSLTSDEPRGTAQPWRLAFLAYIAQFRAVGVPRDRLADLFWPDAERERARHSLSNALYALRKELGENIIHTDRGRVWVDLGVLEVDAVEFEDAIAGGEWDKAVELYRGPLMDGFSAKGSPELQRWLSGRRAELERLYRSALEHIAAATTEAGHISRRKLRDLTAWIVGAAAALALAYSLGQRPAEHPPRLMVLSDFEVDRGDAGLSVALTEAMRVELSEADNIELLDPHRVRSGLRRMRGDTDGGVPRHLARELAEREGAQAVIEGEIRRVGSGYLILARLTAPGTGAVIAQSSHRASARESAGLIDAIARLALAIRRGTGDEFEGLGPADPLPHVTTKSLDAVRKLFERSRVSVWLPDRRRITERRSGIAPRREID